MQLNKFHLIDVIEGLKSLQDNSVDVIISDPPYNIGKDFGICKDNMDMDSYVKWCGTWINECIRILKPSGSFYIYGFSEILAHLSVRIELPKRWLVWSYKNKVTPSYKSGWQRSHESILYIWKKKPVFNIDLVRTPYTERFLRNMAGTKRTKSDTARFGNSADTVYTAHEGGAMPRDVFEIPALAGGSGRERYFLHDGEVYPSRDLKKYPMDKCIKHPTQKPSKLTEKLLLSAKTDNCLVVIPFGGSGSEGVVCKRMGIDFIGFDINEDYIKLANGALDKFDIIF